LSPELRKFGDGGGEKEREDSVEGVSRGTYFDIPELSASIIVDSSARRHGPGEGVRSIGTVPEHHQDHKQQNSKCQGDQPDCRRGLSNLSSAVASSPESETDLLSGGSSPVQFEGGAGSDGLRSIERTGINIKASSERDIFRSLSFSFSLVTCSDFLTDPSPTTNGLRLGATLALLPLSFDGGGAAFAWLLPPPKGNKLRKERRDAGMPDPAVWLVLVFAVVVELL
jgi:hypothetical protein